MSDLSLREVARAPRHQDPAMEAFIAVVYVPWLEGLASL